MPHTARDLLVYWDEARGLPASQFALSLLALAVEGTEAAALAGLSIGERDRLLAMVRIQWFGCAVELRNDCAGCGAPMEAPLDLERLVAEIPPARDPGPVAWGEGTLALRPLTSSDWLALEAAAPEVDAEAFLLCRSADGALDLMQARTLLDDADKEGVVSEAMEAADPFANPWLHLSCPECGGEQQLMLDLASILRGDFAEWERALTEDVHILAAAYGWSEGEILALDRERRLRYRERILS